MTTLIVGATGLVGGEICRILAEAGRSVRALVRTTSSPEKIARLKSLGASIVTPEPDSTSGETIPAGRSTDVTTGAAANEIGVATPRCSRTRTSPTVTSISESPSSVSKVPRRRASSTVALSPVPDWRRRRAIRSPPWRRARDTRRSECPP